MLNPMMWIGGKGKGNSSVAPERLGSISERGTLGGAVLSNPTEAAAARLADNRKGMYAMRRIGKAGGSWSDQSPNPYEGPCA